MVFCRNARPWRRFGRRLARKAYRVTAAYLHAALTPFDPSAALLPRTGHADGVDEDRQVDLYGTALMLEEFGKVIARGGSGVVISSQSGHRLPPLPAEQSKALAMTPTDELLTLPFLQLDQVKDSLHAYQLSKRGDSSPASVGADCTLRCGARIRRSLKANLQSALGPHASAL